MLSKQELKDLRNVRKTLARWLKTVRHFKKEHRQLERDNLRLMHDCNFCIHEPGFFESDREISRAIGQIDMLLKEDESDRFHHARNVPIPCAE